MAAKTLPSRSASDAIPYRFAEDRCVSHGAPMTWRPGSCGRPRVSRAARGSQPVLAPQPVEVFSWFVRRVALPGWLKPAAGQGVALVPDRAEDGRDLVGEANVRAEVLRQHEAAPVPADGAAEKRRAASCQRLVADRAPPAHSGYLRQRGGDHRRLGLLRRKVELPGLPHPLECVPAAVPARHPPDTTGS